MLAQEACSNWAACRHTGLWVCAQAASWVSASAVWAEVSRARRVDRLVIIYV